MAALCRPDDVRFVEGTFQRTFEARTLHDFETVLNKIYFTPVHGHLAAGDVLNVARYVNEDWHAVVGVLPGIRVVSSTKQSVPLLIIREPLLSGLAPERGFVIKHDQSFLVRHDGWIVGEFNTRIEAEEFIARKGCSTRLNVQTGQFVVRRGVEELGSFSSSPEAAAFIARL